MQPNYKLLDQGPTAMSDTYILSRIVAKRPKITKTLDIVASLMSESEHRGWKEHQRVAESEPRLDLCSISDLSTSTRARLGMELPFNHMAAIMQRWWHNKQPSDRSDLLLLSDNLDHDPSSRDRGSWAPGTQLTVILSDMA